MSSGSPYSSIYEQMLKQLMVSYGTSSSPPLWTPPEEPKQPEPTGSTPTITGSVIGYRAWRIKDWRLTGTGVNRAWVPGVNEATCDRGPSEDQYGFTINFGVSVLSHPAPHPGCHCGITCLARFDENDEHWTMADVFGAIEAWSEYEDHIEPARPGDVAHAAGVETGEQHEERAGFILHRNGFRARYGKVVLLAVDDEWPAAKKAAVRALAREHSADVCKRSHLEDAAKEHGQLVPDDLLRWVKETEPPAPTPDYGGGYFISPQVVISNNSITTYSSGAWAPLYTPNSRRKPSRPQGIKQTIGYPGPPADPTQKHRKGDRIRDNKGVIWLCVKGGKGGTWEKAA